MSALSQHPRGDVSYLRRRRGEACIGSPWSGSRERSYQGLVRARADARYWVPRRSWAEWRQAQPTRLTAPAGVTSGSG